MVVKAPKKALTPIPSRTRKTGLSRRPIKTRTQVMASSAPKNAATYVPPPPRNENQPSKIAPTAPVDAPAEIPRTYGSASGLRVSVCMTSPVVASTAPAAKRAKIRGARTNSTSTCDTGRTAVSALVILPYKMAVTSATGMSTEPK